MHHKPNNYTDYICQWTRICLPQYIHELISLVKNGERVQSETVDTSIPFAVNIPYTLITFFPKGSSMWRLSFQIISLSQIYSKRERVPIQKPVCSKCLVTAFERPKIKDRWKNGLRPPTGPTCSSCVLRVLSWRP